MNSTRVAAAVVAALVSTGCMQDIEQATAEAPTATAAQLSQVRAESAPPGAAAQSQRLEAVPGTAWTPGCNGLSAACSDGLNRMLLIMVLLRARQAPEGE